MSLEAAINTPEGEFIKEKSITGTVKFPKSQMDGKFFTCLLEDGQLKANLSCKADLFTANDGKRVTFLVNGRGKGYWMKRGDAYKGTPKISLGELVEVAAPGTPTDVQKNSKETQAYQTPATRTENTGQTVKGGNGATAEEMAKTWAAVARATFSAFKEHFEEEVATEAALKAPEWAALWWFGERTVRREGPSRVSQLARQVDPQGDHEPRDEDQIPF